MHTRSHLEPYFGTFGGREAPPETVALLREIDPDAELVYLGKGIWLLGAVRPSDARRDGAAALLDDLEEVFGLAGSGTAAPISPEIKQQLAVDLLECRMLYRGFAKIAAYQVQGWPGALLVEDFRERDFVYRTRFAEKWRELAAEASGDAGLERRIKGVRTYLEDNKAHIERHAFRKPHTTHGRNLRRKARAS